MGNSLRIVCNPYDKHLSYYFMNEYDAWVVCSENSPLSRRYYTDTTLEDRANEIISKIDEVYNRNNRGLNIFFEGTESDFSILERSVRDFLPDRKIECKLGTTKIAVVGKRSVGKTFLIEGMEGLLNYRYEVKKGNDYSQYVDECNHAIWYEINGIELGLENVETAYNTVCSLINDGLSNVVYCVQAATGRIEEPEKELIRRITDNYPQISVVVAITQGVGDTSPFIDEIKKITDQIKVVVTLARKYIVESNKPDAEIRTVVEPFGLTELSQYIFERR